MRYEKRLFGIPESLNVLALYYNPTFVSDPPIDVQQLVQSLDADTRLALPVGFFQAYWGMDPFGGFEYDSYTNRIGETQGLINWLATLQQAAARPALISISMPRRPRMPLPLKKRPTSSAVHGRCRACVKSWAMTASTLYPCPMARSCRAAQCSRGRAQ